LPGVWLALAELAAHGDPVASWRAKTRGLRVLAEHLGPL
jgi:hypothetical protein